MSDLGSISSSESYSSDSNSSKSLYTPCDLVMLHSNIESKNDINFTHFEM